MSTAGRETTNSQARFDDAWEQYRTAIDRLEAGDIRDACGKAWNATRAAAEAAVLAHHGSTATTNHIAAGFVGSLGPMDSLNCQPSTRSGPSTCISAGVSTVSWTMTKYRN